MLFSVLSRTPAFYRLDNRRPYHRVGRDRSPRRMPLSISSARKTVTPSPILSGCSLVSLAWVLRQPASTSQTQVTTIC